MGAQDFQSTALGRTPQEAFAAAVRAAEDEHGHQQGYSGEVNAKHGYVLAQLPPRVTVKRMLGWLNEADYAAEVIAEPGVYGKAEVRDAERTLRRIPAQHRDEVVRLARLYSDKWGPALAFAADAATQREILKRRRERGYAVPRGTKVYVFCGTAPS